MKVLALALLAGLPCLAQPCPAGSSPIAIPMSLVYSRVVLFPSFTPRGTLKVSLAGIARRDRNALEAAGYATRPYTVTGPTNTPLHLEDAGVRSGADTVYLSLAPGSVHNGDTLAVCIHSSVSGTYYASNVPATVSVKPGYAISLEPSYLKSQTLVNRQKRDVAHLDTKIDIPYLARSIPGFAWYFKSAATLSTDGKDNSTSTELETGWRRNLLRSGYLPFFWGGRGLLDQTARNASAFTQAGVNLFIPEWRRIASLGNWLNNTVISAPAPPAFTFALQHQWRIDQDDASRIAFPNDRSVRLFGQANWTPVRLLRGNDLATIDPGSLAIELAGKGWCYPHETRHSAPSVQRLEGLLEASLLIAVSTNRLQIIGRTIGVTSDQPKQRVRIKYTYGANEAKNFTHLHQLSIGIESVK